MPQRSWIDIQKDQRMPELGSCRWWAVAPLIGGGVCIPEPLAEFVRPATLEDALAVAERHRGSYFTLVRVFPALADAMPAPKY